MSASSSKGEFPANRWDVRPAIMRLSRTAITRSDYLNGIVGKPHRQMAAAAGCARKSRRFTQGFDFAVARASRVRSWLMSLKAIRHQESSAIKALSASFTYESCLADDHRRRSPIIGAYVELAELSQSSDLRRARSRLVTIRRIRVQLHMPRSVDLPRRFIFVLIRRVRYWTTIRQSTRWPVTAKVRY